MPNLNCEINIPKGTFSEIDSKIEYGELQFKYPLKNNELKLFKGEQHFNIDEIFFKICHNNETLSKLRLIKSKIVDQVFYKVSKVHSTEKMKGYAHCLYRNAIEYLDYPIISDNVLTLPGSYNIWQKLINDYKRDEVNVKIIDTIKKQEKDYNMKYARTQIWGFDEDFIGFIKDDISILDEAHYNKEVSNELFIYLRDNYKKIRDRRHILLSLQKSTPYLLINK